MLTQCPSCQTIYRLRAEELAAANGFVACGECHTQFNALSRIADEPSFAGQTQTATQDASNDVSADYQLEPIQEPGGQATAFPTANPNDRAAQSAVAAHLDTASTSGVAHSPYDPNVDDGRDLDSTLDLSLEEISPSTLTDEEHSILFTEIDEQDLAEPLVDELDAEEIVAQPVAVDQAIDLDEIPAVFQDEVLAMSQPKPSQLRWLWWLLGIILLLAMVAQISWHYRETIIAHFPQTEPIMRGACDYLNCRVENNKTSEPIQLLTRDVRDHPQYENTLLVNATVVNSGDTVAEFPVVELSLHDHNGEALGVRRFKPSEYLDKSIDLGSGLPPGRSIYVVFELAGVGDKAVSFEFSFL